MRTGTKRRLSRLWGVVLAGTLVGVAYSVVLNFTKYGTLKFEVLDGAIYGFLLSSTIGAMEIFETRTRPGRAVEQAPFLVTLVVKGLIYGSLIWFLIIADPVPRLLGRSPGAGSQQLVSLVFSIVATVAFIFVLQISQIIGGRTLRDWVLGRYHRPRSEQRFFLFADIVGSTTLAERIGPVRVHQFLNRVFVLASDPVDEHCGEIYQYVGDEMVVTWTEADGRLGARPIACFAAIETALKAAAPEFIRDFGIAARVRGALHVGPVVVGEIGGRKRDIVFHGDVMNTTSRLEEVAREVDQKRESVNGR
jgi:adenylate cyclase